MFEIFIFCPKIQLWFPEKIVDFLGWKTRENVVVLDFIAVDNFDFTRKIVKKIWLINSWKCWGYVKIEFLDKNLTFRLVCIRKKRMNFNTWRCPRNQTFHRKIDLRVQPGIGGLRPFVDILDRRRTIGLLKTLKKMSKRKLTASFLWPRLKITQFSWIDFEMIGDEEWVIN